LQEGGGRDGLVDHLLLLHLEAPFMHLKGGLRPLVVEEGAILGLVGVKDEARVEALSSSKLAWRLIM
jgi:hypothetical protein